MTHAPRLVEEWCDLARQTENLHLSPKDQTRLLEVLTAGHGDENYPGEWGYGFGRAWILIQNPIPAEALKAQWAKARVPFRQGMLIALLETSPDRARALLHSTWESEILIAREAFLRSFVDYVRPGDEPFLLSVLDERKAALRFQAAIGLGRLGHSLIVEDAMRLIAKSLTIEPDFEVALPDRRDPMFSRLGVETTGGMGGREWPFLEDFVSLIPPSAWEKIGLMPEKVSPWRFSATIVAFQSGIDTAVRRYGDARWAERLLPSGSFYPGSLLAPLDQASRERYVLETMPSGDTETLMARHNLLAFRPWSKEVSQWFVRAAPAVDPGVDPHDRFETLPDTAFWFHPDVELPETVPTDWEAIFAHWRKILVIRRQIHAAFQELSA